MAVLRRAGLGWLLACGAASAWGADDLGKAVAVGLGCLFGGPAGRCLLPFDMALERLVDVAFQASNSSRLIVSRSKLIRFYPFVVGG